MTAEALEECEVDVCAACGGVWIDWFDGEVRAVAKEVLTGTATGRITPRPSDPGDVRSEPRAMGACPRCMRQLAMERYVVNALVRSEDRRDLVRTTTETGADLMRCEECAGVFVSRTAMETLSTLPKNDEAPRSENPAKVLEPLPWQKLLAVIRRLFGMPS
jgi:Zn-finger nucleic acid-binding protein